MAYKVVMPLDFPGIPHDETVFDEVGAEFVKQQCNSEDEIAALAGDAEAIITITTHQPIGRSLIEKLNKCRFI